MKQNITKIKTARGSQLNPTRTSRNQTSCSCTRQSADELPTRFPPSGMSRYHVNPANFTQYFNDKNRNYLSRYLIPVFMLVIAATAVNFAGAEETFRLKVVTDHKNAIYETGQPATFLVTLTKGNKPVATGEVSYIVDDFITAYPLPSNYPKGKLKIGSDSKITVTSKQPGFLRCRVSYRTPENKLIRATAGAGFSPLKIQPSLPVPDDFDEFWSSQKTELAKIAMDAKLTPVEYANESIECFDVQLACLGGAPVSGYFAKPKNAKPKSLPIILWVHGAGVRSSSLGNAVKGATSKMLSMDINAHGLPNGKPADFYSELRAGKLNGYPFFGREDRETIYFRGMFLRLVRAIDFLTSQPEWDGRVVAVIGHSQGGGQALVAGGLDQRVTFIAAGVPAICDHSGRAIGRINGWPKLVPTETDGKPNAKILQVARYFDAVNFASRSHADAIMSVGFIDPTCPPSSCYAAYNQLSGEKQIINEPLMSHAAPAHIHKAFFEAVKKHVKQTR